MNASVCNALQAKRRAHLANVQLLEATLTNLAPDDADRARRTIAHLKGQISRINDQLRRPAPRTAA